MTIEARRVTKAFGSFVALNDVSFTVNEGELVALLGPSGCGKTTLLRIIAGLERADAGAVLFDGADATNRSAKDRNVGFVFQHYALFRHMTVFENVAFGLRVRARAVRQPDAQINRKVHEPFGALDAQVRQELRRWLRRLHSEIHLTSVFVTHDQEEALELANRIVVMNKGVIEQEGTPDDVVEHPASPFVLHFIGNVNIFHGRVQDGKALLGPLAVEYPDHPSIEPRDATGYTRPHEFDLIRT